MIFDYQKNKSTFILSKEKEKYFFLKLLFDEMKGIVNPASEILENSIPGSPLSGHRTSLVENIQIPNETIHNEESHQKLTFKTFLSLTLHSLGIIFGDM